MPLPLFGSLSDQRKDEAQKVIPAGWRQNEHPATKILHQFPFNQQERASMDIRNTSGLLWSQSSNYGFTNSRVQVTQAKPIKT